MKFALSAPSIKNVLRSNLSS